MGKGEARNTEEKDQEEKSRREREKGEKEVKGRERRGEGTMKEQGIRKVRRSLRRKKMGERNRSMKGRITGVF